jgi:hypothetical protein
VKITLFISIYAVTDFIALAVADVQNSKAKISYIYYSTSGTILLVMRFFLFLWFMHATWTTHQNFQSKHGFYSKFRIAFGGWIISTPLILAFGNLIDTNARLLYVQAFRVLAMFLAQSTLAFLYNPNTDCNQSFPFHQNTAEFMAMTKKRPPPRAEGALEQNEEGGSTGGAVLRDNTSENISDVATQVKDKIKDLQQYSEGLLAQLQDMEDSAEDYDEDFGYRERSNAGRRPGRPGPPSGAPPPSRKSRGPPRGAPPPMSNRRHPYDDYDERGFGNNEPPHGANTLDRVLNDTIPHQRTSHNPRG